MTSIDGRQMEQRTRSAASNLVINAEINAWMLAGKGPHLLTVDSISTLDTAVFGSGVPLAVSLSFILSAITFFTFRKKATRLTLAPPA